MTGQRFGRWTVIQQAGRSSNNSVIWQCKCDCGVIKNVNGVTLRNGSSLSCGCLNKEINSLRNQNKKINRYDLSGEYGIGFTEEGKQFWFDKEDYKKILPYYWTFNQSGYVVSVGVESEKRIRLSRFVMNCLDEKCLIDHIEHHLYDNRKSHLRKANNSQNTMNSILKSNNSSGVTGVSWDKKRNKWIVSIMKNYKAIYLGRFDDFEDAVKARKSAEEIYFGEWSYENSQKKIKEAL